jgi:cytochrome c
MMLVLLLAWLVSFASPQGVPIPVRPRDPWVFRCVLDKKPRIVTIALSHDMWIAYDATTCGLYKAWRGDVRFDGAVYTTVHGPQPTSVGESYTVGPTGDVWSARIGEKEVPLRVKWLGFQIHNGRAHLNYQMFLEDGRHIRVQETPEYVSAESVLPVEIMDQFSLIPGMPGLYRSFSAEAIPDDVVLFLRVYTDGANAKFPYPPDGLSHETQVEVDGKRREQSLMAFNHEVLRPNLVLFFDPLPDPPAPDATEKK